MPRCNHVGIIAIICVCVLNSMVFSLQPAQALNNQNLVKNGDFSQGLVSWETGIDYPVGDYPQFYANEGRLAMDIPYNSSGYVKQELFIPFTSKAVLSLKVWGAQCRADVCIVIQNLTAYYLIEYIETEVLEGYDNIPFTRTYDITEFTGQNVTLFLWAQGRGSPTGSFAYFDDVQIEAATGKNTVITLSMKGERIAAHTTLIRLGQSIEAFGSIYPAQDAVIELEFIKPNGDQFEKTVRTDSLGRYDYTFIPDVRGVWNVSSSWLGNSQFNGARSPSHYFVVTGGESNVTFVSCTINNKDIDKPEIEAKVSEQLSGWIYFNLTDWYRFTQVWIVGADSWEYNNSTEILNEWGIHGDYIGVKIASDFTNDRTVYVPFNKNDGSFTISVKWKFPSSNTTLSLITPLKEETYYIAVLSGEVIDYADLLDNGKAAIMYSETFNKTVSSIWHLNSTEWEMLLPPNSIRPEMFAIKVHVVDVDKPMSQANITIIRAERNGLDMNEAKRIFSEGLIEYENRNFTQAKKLFNQAENTADVLIKQLEQEVGNKIGGFQTLYSSFITSNLMDLIDFFDSKSPFNVAIEKYAIDDYRDAENSIDKAIQNLYSSLFIVVLTLTFFLLYGLIINGKELEPELVIGLGPFMLAVLGPFVPLKIIVFIMIQWLLLVTFFFLKNPRLFAKELQDRISGILRKRKTT